MHVLTVQTLVTIFLMTKVGGIQLSILGKESSDSFI